jgi:hypothetical protein
MSDRIPQQDYPLWVKLSTWGVPGRAGLWAFTLLSVALAVASIVYGFWDRRFLAGSLLFFAAWLYWSAIRWIDRNGSRDGDPPESPDEW